MDFALKFLSILFVAALPTISRCNRSAPLEEPDEMVLHHVLHTKIAGLDPASISDIYSRIVASQIFETLYDYHFLKRPYELGPLMAEDMPRISKDRLVYTIKIKKGVTFRATFAFRAAKPES